MAEPATDTFVQYDPRPNSAKPKETRASEKAAKQIEKVVSGTHDVLFSSSTVFPFTLFPDTVSIDREKLNITHRDFFRVAETISIRIEDVLNVTATVGPFFGSIIITSRFFDTNKPYHVNFFWREDALKIQRIMEGYLVAIKKEIDCSALSTKELADTLDQLGKQ